MTRAPMIAALVLPLAGCGSASEQAATTNNTAAAVPDDYVARIRALPPGQRDGVLLRAVRDAGRDCQQVTKSTAIPDIAGAPAWQATCADGGSWVVAFNPGGVATVTSATDIARAQGN